ncbi:MAG: FAD-dependent oxidoreductase, partial [Bdellovibrionales bacterium]|nr:FAD-dependent oxidoreductase [Oligoflexia bacterium]
MKAHLYSGLVSNLTYLAKDIVLIAFQPNVRVKFLAGQFFSLLVPGTDVYRLYSLASPPDLNANQPYEVLIRLVPGGLASDYLRSLKAGDRIQFRAPYGEFHLKSPSDRHLFFLSTGTGVGVLRSILESNQIKSFSGSKFGLFGFRNREEEVFRDSFTAMPDFNYRYCISQDSGPLRTDEYRGRVSDFLRAMPEEFPWRNTDFYLCGNGEMIETVTSHLTL